MTGATTTPMPKIAMAMPCFSRGKLSTRMACETGCSAPPPSPCRTRKKISTPSEGAMPHKKELNVNSATQII